MASWPERASTGAEGTPAREKQQRERNNARDAGSTQKTNKKPNRHARASAGTLYEPEAKKISQHPEPGAGAPDFAFVALDTGTDRPGLEKSTYKARRRRSATPSPRSCCRRVFLIDRCSRTSSSRTSSIKSATPRRYKVGAAPGAPRVPHDCPGELPRYDRRVAPR